jgi:hypothetical protein
MKLTTSNATVTNTVVSSTIKISNNNLAVESLTVGNVSINSSTIAIGNTTITPTAISTPSLVIGGSSFGGGLFGGIVNYQEFTANGTWNNPSVYLSGALPTQGLTYTYYIQGSSTNPTTEAGLAALFNTATSSPTVSFGGTGTHSTNINWSSDGTTGAGGVTGSKPTYLPADQFSWMVEGYILAPETGTYFFGCDGDDAMDVFVNGVNVANFYGGHGFAASWTAGVGQVSGSISLTAGQYYTFRARMQDGGSADGFQVGWRKPSDGSIALIPSSAFYTSTPTYVQNTSYTGYEQVLIMAWGAGGGSNTGFGGGGSACVIGQASLQTFSNTCSITVGLGAVGAVGGSTTFAINTSSSIIAYGGGNANTTATGGGGGTLSAGAIFAGGSPLGGGGNSTSTQLVSTFGGAGVNGTIATTPYGSIFGGGAGVLSAAGGAGGSIYGGGGGSNGSALGVSIFGGNGGNNTTNALAPGGGAGGTGSKAGARGEVRVWVIGPGATTIGAATYTVSPSTTTTDGGDTILFTATTTNVANGSTLYYTLNTSSTATSSDFTADPSGTTIVNNGQATISITSNSSLVSSTTKTYNIDIRTGSTSGPIVASSAVVTLHPKANKFTTTGATTFTVPAGITTLYVKQWGAGC